MNWKNTVLPLLILTILAGGIFLSCSKDAGSAKTKKSAEESDIAYWTCSMHPSVKSDGPGACPICHMDLIPVRASDQGKIVVPAETAERIGLEVRPAEKAKLFRTLRLPARVSEDPDLYLTEQEYISAFRSGDRGILSSARLRLELAGYSPSELKKLERTGTPDRTLVYPGRTVWVTADITENDLALVRTGQSVLGRVLAYPGRTFTGTIAGIESRVNESTRSSRARIRFDNPAGELKLGMYVHAEFRSSLGMLLSLPSEAIIDTGSRQVVYVALDETRYEMRPVKAGLRGEDAEGNAMTAVLEGIQPGELIVVRGNFLLDSQSTLTSGSSQLYGAGEEVKTPSSSGSGHNH